MLESNFSLKCKDGKTVKVSKEQLGSFSSVFKDILSIDPADGKQSCAIEETSGVVKIALEVLNGKKGTRTMSQLKSLLKFALKYDIWSLEMFAKVHLKTYHRSNAQDLFEFACLLDDEELALDTLKMLIQKGVDIEELDLSKSWKTRAVNYLNATKSAAFNRCKAIDFARNQGRPCLRCVQSLFRLKSIIYDALCLRPLLSSAEVLEQAGYYTRLDVCFECGHHVILSSKEWDQSVKETEEELDAGF